MGTKLHFRANYAPGRIARGGALTVSDSELSFRPNWFESMLLFGPRSWKASDIQSIDTVPPDGGIFSGGMRTRLRINHIDGGLLFVVRDAEKAADAIRSAWGRD